MKVPIPKELAHLKVDERGYPIPFFVPYIDGKPSFRFLDQKKQFQCINEKRCPVCGKKLYKDYCYIISGPMGLFNHIGTDPPMHRVCAEFALAACPHLHFEKAERKETAFDKPYLAKEKPDCLFLVKCSKFKGVPDGYDGLLVSFTDVSSEKFVYVNNQLVKQ